MTANKKRFSFTSELSPDIFEVVRFNGTEGLSEIYRFEIELVSADSELDLVEIVENTVTMKFLRDGKDDVRFNGILSEFEQLHQSGGRCFYRAVLVPRVWRLTQTPYNQVFLNKSVTEIIRQVLDKAGFKEDMDYEIHLKAEDDYPEWEYICQYRETHMAFLTRLMEREGIYYCFKQEDSRDKLIITDYNIHSPMIDEKEDVVFYSPPSGLDETDRGEIIRNFSCRQAVIPDGVRLKDHCQEKPDMNMEFEKEISGQESEAADRLESYLFGEHLKTEAEGERLARIRAEEIRCRRQSFSGDTTIPFLRPGYVFTLWGHFRSSFNQDYLSIAVTHRGNQTALMLSGLPGETSAREKEAEYYNSVSALPADIQFRPKCKTEKPRIYGTLHARIDAEGDGRYAELDEEGRYKVILPFDISGRRDGKASAPVRMMQPYTGADYGMHFPLHKGAEVLLTFIDGDPDRPVIAGAISNPENPSVVNGENQTQCNIITAGGNKVLFEDKKDCEQILLRCPHTDTLIKLGYPLENTKFYKKMGFSGFADGFGTVIGAVLNYKKALVKLVLDGVGLIWGNPVGADDGIEMNTENGLKIVALKKSEEIGSFANPGYSETNVTGLNVASTMGYTIVSTTGRHEFSVLGNYETSIMGFTQKLETVRQTLKGKEQNAGGWKKKMWGKADSLAGKATNLVGAADKLVGKENEVKGSASEMSGSESSLTGSDKKVSGSSSGMSGKETKMTGASTSMDGKKSAMAGKTTEMSGAKTSLEGKSTSLSGAKTGLDGKNTELTGVKTII